MFEVAGNVNGLQVRWNLVSHKHVARNDNLRLFFLKYLKFSCEGGVSIITHAQKSGQHCYTNLMIDFCGETALIRSVCLEASLLIVTVTEYFFLQGLGQFGGISSSYHSTYDIWSLSFRLVSSLQVAGTCWFIYFH